MGVAVFYKGVGVGTYLHSFDLRVTGLSPHNPGGPRNIAAIMSHIARGTTYSAYVSLTSSYGVAREYAFAGRTHPTRHSPAHVYEVHIGAPCPGLVDPVRKVTNIKPFRLPPAYHHRGDQRFLLGVVDPAGHSAHLTKPEEVPPGLTMTPKRPPHLAIELETVVRALRDAEVLFAGHIPSFYFVNRYDVF